MNDVKFELLCYSQNQTLKDQSNYPSGKIIKTKDVVKDLFIFMSSDGMFKYQIKKSTEKAKKPHILDPMIQLKNPNHNGHTLQIPHDTNHRILLRSMESQYRRSHSKTEFLKKINRSPKNYWDCLKEVNIFYSLQRRTLFFKTFHIVKFW